jgi:hypothetical protein
MQQPDIYFKESRMIVGRFVDHVPWPVDKSVGGKN